MDQRPRVSAAQLIDTINTPYQNEENRQGQESAEDLEPIRNGRGFVRDFLSLVISQGVFDDQGNEDAQREYLKGETGDGDVDGGFGSTGRSSREGTTDGLQAEREDVAGDEDPKVEFGGEAGVLGTEVDDTKR